MRFDLKKIMSKYILPFAFLGVFNLNAQQNNTNLLALGNQSNNMLFANNSNANSISNNRVSISQVNYDQQIMQNQSENANPQQYLSNLNNNKSNENKTQTFNDSKKSNEKIDLTISLKKSVSISKKSRYKKSKTYYNKWNKLKRKTFGKLTSNKKTKFRVDLCFNWI